MSSTDNQTSLARVASSVSGRPKPSSISNRTNLANTMKLSKQILLTLVFGLATVLAGGSAKGATTYDLAPFTFTYFDWATDARATLKTSAYGTYTTKEEIEDFFNQATYSATLKDGTTTLFEMNNGNSVWRLDLESWAGNASVILTCTPTELTLDFSTPGEITGAALYLQGELVQPDGYIAVATVQYGQANNISDGTGFYFIYDAVNEAAGGLDYDAPFIFPAIVREPAESVEGLIAQVIQSGLSVKRTHPLLATLEAALASFRRESLRSGVNQLGAFQNKVRAQVAPDDRVLATTWIASAQEIIDAAQATVGMPLK
jgi:hypothetical protein